MLILGIAILFLLTSATLAFAESVPDEVQTAKRFRLIPDIVTVQYAGNMGLASIGLGYHSKGERSSAYLIYGYLPKSESGVEVKTIAVKGFVETSMRHPFKGVTTSNYAGLNLLYARTKNTHILWPDHYPSGYYEPNAIHLAPIFGGKMDFDIKNSRYIDKAGVFVEVGTLGYYMKDYLKSSNHRSLAFGDIWNVSAGFSISLNKVGFLKLPRIRI